MSDKELDNLIKDALITEDVPSSLNESVILSLKKKEKQKAKVLKFVKGCSSCAAVFICAVAIISYFEGDTKKYTDKIKEENISAGKVKEEIVISEKTNEEEKVAPKITSEKSTVKKEVPEKTQNASLSEDSSPAIVEESSEDAITEEAPAIFSRARSIAPSSLSALFNEDYDYKSAISEIIKVQIALMDFPEPIDFSSITGEESFSLNEENVLTISFPAGTIASEEHGDLFFRVGTVQNGVLR